MATIIGAAGGITKLSELEIDAEKDWQAKAITNLQAIVAAMIQGDLPVRGGIIIERLIPGSIGHVLTSAGPGHIPSWQPTGGPLEKWFPVPLDKPVPAASVVTLDKSAAEEAAPGTGHDETTTPTKQPGVASEEAAAVVTLDKSASEEAPADTGYVCQILVGGAVADDGGVETDETAEAQNPTVDDMTLLPAGPAVGDAYDFGFMNKFSVARLNVSTPGVGVWTITWKYWNGAAWADLSGVDDGTSGFTVGGTNDVSFTVPGDWALTTIQGMNLYWIRAEVTAYTSITTQPLGAQAWVKVTG